MKIGPVSPRKLCSIVVLAFVVTLLSSCSNPGPDGKSVDSALAQPFVGGVDYRGEALPCVYNVGRKPATRTTIPLLDCDFDNFYDKYPELLSDSSLPELENKTQQFRAVNVGERVLICVTSAVFPPEEGKDRPRASDGAACDWPRWHASLKSETPPEVAFTKEIVVSGVAYRSETLPCAMDVLGGEGGFWDSDPLLFSCDFHGFYETYPELLEDKTTTDVTVVENVRFARWAKMGESEIYCLNTLVYESRQQHGGACDWIRWDESMRGVE